MDRPDIICREEGRWSCLLAADWTISLPKLAGRANQPYFFRVEKADRQCREWLRLDPDGTLTLRTDYASDGCSMVPDFHNALPGCILHDALRQALRLDPTRCPWTRAEADHIFRDILQAYGFGWFGSWLYYIGVAGPTGWLYSWLLEWLFPPKDVVCR